MTAPRNEAALRNWLVDYLVTTIGCSPDDIDFDASLNTLGVGSRDAVVLSGELSELIGRPVSPVDFWEHPTITTLARFLASAEPESVAGTGGDQVVRATDEPIAVIGLGCRFPGEIAGPEAYWQFLRDQRSAVGTVPPERWLPFDDGSPEVAAAMSRTTRWGSFLADVEAFDAEYFDIPPSEADKMDPQQRLLLEVAHEALEHAGIPAHSLRHSQTGVFAGACAGEYAYLATADLSQVDSWTGTGGALSIIANRVSYFFDLRGPSVTVDTACSSSLVAIHLACQSLLMGDSNLALAAGVNLMLSPAVTRSFDRLEAMSPSGQCHSFDARADGFVRGEGCGVVVLKRLGDALNDGDRILAVVRGSAVNQDGRSNGLMAPNPATQMAVLRSAYATACVDPREVDYVEAHGTGTLLGDPIEARALGTVLGRGRAVDSPLLIGAVKSNLGHLEAAAGVAGFIKAVLAVQRGHIPANLGFQDPNPHIPFDSLRLKVVAEHTDWPAVDRPRRAGVSSFGFGGTNAHVVVEQAPTPAVRADRAPGPAPVVSTLVVSGKSAERVASLAAMLADWLDGAGAEVRLADVAHTLDHHRARHSKFATVVATDHGQAVAGLRALAAGQQAPGVVGFHDGVCRTGTVFVYSGQGSQWAGMCRRLLADEPAFAAAVADIEPDFVAQVGFSLLQVLRTGQPVVGIDRIQPVLVGVQLALTQLWRSYGVIPDAVIGHSMGEVAAAVVSGALSAADGLRVIATRSRLMSRLSGQGAMALVELDAAAAEGLVAGYPDLTVAVFASPRQTVIAGPPEQVDAAIAVVAAQDRLARRIEVDVASHHPIIDPVLPQLRVELADLTPRPPSIPVYSTTVEAGTIEPTFDADYWAANLRNPVRFSRAVAEAGVEAGTFVEVSPHPVLTYAIDDTLSDLHHHSIATLQRDADDTVTFHTNLNATHTMHTPATDHGPEPHPELPTTPWHHTRHWVAFRERFHTGGSVPRTGTLLGEHISVATAPATQLWRAKLTPEAKPYPGSHRLRGLEVVPVSVLLHTLSAAAEECGAAGLDEVRFEYPLAVDRPRVVQVVVDGDRVTVSSSADTEAHRWVSHVRARLATPPDHAPTPSASADVAGAETGETRSVAELLNTWGVEGQPFDWTVDALRHTADGGLVAAVRVPDVTPVALVDAAVHVARLADGADPRLMVPAAVEAAWQAATLPGPGATIQVRRRPGADDELIVDIAATSSDGAVVVDIRGLRFADVESDRADATVGNADPRSMVHEIAWRPWNHGKEPGVPATLALLGDPAAADALQPGLQVAGFTAAEVSEARCVVYVAGVAVDERDVDAAARMTAEVGELLARLAARDTRQPAALWIVTRGVREPAAATALAQSSLWGVAAVIAAEQPDLWGGLVDLPADEPIESHATTLAALLPTPAKAILAVAGGKVLTSELVAAEGESVRDPARCRPDAAYLVTGGLGALGLLTAGWLADRGARRLVLAGRSALPPRHDWDDPDLDRSVRQRIDAVRALELRGVSVEAVAVDIGSRDGINALLARRDRDGAPPIRGIVHGAGVTENRLLTDLGDGSARRVMWPKIAGAQALHEAFGPGSLDFFYLTASAGTVFGVPGQGSYAAANAYLDCLARLRHRQGCRTLSLDWVAWRGLGFASEAAIVLQELERWGSRPVNPDEAFAAWEYVERFDIAQAVMAPMPSGGQNGPERFADQPERAWAQMEREDILRALEAGLQAILARELRLPESELDVERPFAEFGLNSVTAMSIRRDAELLVGLELSATMLWNHPTIAALAVYLAERLSPQEASAGVADEPTDSVLDSLFDSVESSAAGAEGGI